jgi:hypothetical protein
VGSLRAASALALLVAASLGLGCFTWNPWAPDQSPRDPAEVAPSRAVHLQPGDDSAGGLDCKAGRCDQWFRVDVDRGAVLRVEVQVEGLTEGAVARLFLQDGTGRNLGQATSRDGLPLRVEGYVEPGPYAVLLQAGGGPIVFRLDTALE